VSSQSRPSRWRRRRLGEIPSAYKDIDEVMKHARDLVDVKGVLKQFVNVKGD
jgi:tRNA-splicing ligase RtcB